MEKIHEIGEVIGKFKLVSLLGKNSYSESWKAIHLELSNKYEVFKFILSEEILKYLKERSKFLYLDHPSIIKVTDLDTVSICPYIRMEYVKGETLENLLEKENKIPWHFSLKLICEIIKPLKLAYQNNIIHGNLKPSNIFILKKEPLEIKIGDFLGEALLEQKVIYPKDWEYRSPEQKQGKLYPQSDIYSLGIILYKCITGTFPSTLKFPSDFIPDCPPKIDEVIKKMLSPLSERYNNFEELEKDLELCFYREVIFDDDKRDNKEERDDKKEQNTLYKETYQEKTTKVEEIDNEILLKYLFSLFKKEYFYFIGGIFIILIGLGFTRRIPLSLIPLLIIGLILLEISRPEIPNFWTNLSLWGGIGLAFISIVQRAFPLWFALFFICIGILSLIYERLEEKSGEEIGENKSEDNK